MKLTNGKGDILNYYPLKHNTTMVLKQGYGSFGVVKEYINREDMPPELNSKLDDGYTICGFNGATD